MKSILPTKLHLIIMNIKMLLLIIVIQLSSCSHDDNSSKYNQLNTYLKLKEIDISKKQSILILSDKGCINCNRSFSNLIQNYLDRDDVLVINQADGSRLDITLYLNHEKVINDFNKKLDAYIDLNHSAAIFIHDAHIDTIVSIEAKTIRESIPYLEEKLKN